MNDLSRRQPATLESNKTQALRKLRIYSHSSLFYWWPVWVIGYLMAILTYWQGQQELIGQDRELVHPSSNLGVIFFLTLFLVILITNFSARGMGSAMIILGAAFVTLLLAYLGWWDEVLSWFGAFKIHLNLGAYFWFSTLLLVAWTVTVFGLDRVSYWEVKPGELTHESLFGSQSKSYSTQGMSLEKHRGDVFRDWVLGLGSGDLQIRTSGATRETLNVPNVLFIGAKAAAIQRFIAEVPDGPTGA